MEKFDIHTPKEEVDRILRKAFKREIEDSFRLGLPVSSVDEIGVYELYPDGRKVYVKSMKKNNERG